VFAWYQFLFQKPANPHGGQVSKMMI
jgi:hypothetical protein